MYKDELLQDFASVTALSLFLSECMMFRKLKFRILVLKFSLN